MHFVFERYMSTVTDLFQEPSKVVSRTGRGIRNLKRGNSFGFKLPAFDARKFRDIAVPELDSRGIVRDVSHT
ncbi:hypothetical protein N7475_004229 [Penicillium sp. IBT 31633x]|nr:hypothetical protein N7475_004229 [Penicillium sp. IBT 31633x]